MDPASTYGDSQSLHHQQQSLQQPLQSQQQRQRQERDQEYWQQQKSLQQYHQQLANAAAIGAGMSVASPSSSSSRANNKPPLPTRSSTVGSPQELERRNGKLDSHALTQHARSEDLNHGSGGVSTNGMSVYPSIPTQGSPVQAYLSLSRPMTPADGVMLSGALSSSSHSDTGGSGTGEEGRVRRLSSTSNVTGTTSKTSTNASQAAIQSTICAACQQQLEGAFVRALGNVWHLPCFKCKVSFLLTVFYW